MKWVLILNVALCYEVDVRLPNILGTVASFLQTVHVQPETEI